MTYNDLLDEFVSLPLSERIEALPDFLALVPHITSNRCQDHHGLDRGQLWPDKFLHRIAVKQLRDLADVGKQLRDAHYGRLAREWANLDPYERTQRDLAYKHELREALRQADSASPSTA